MGPPPILEESKDDTKSMSNDSEDSEIERMFDGFSDCEDGLFDSNYDIYLTGVQGNKIGREDLILKKGKRKRSKRLYVKGPASNSNVSRVVRKEIFENQEVLKGNFLTL